MNEFSIILQQLLQLAIVFMIGFLAAKFYIITNDSLPVFSKLISKILLPVYIFANIVKDGSIEKMISYTTLFYFLAAIYVIPAVTFAIVLKCCRMTKEHGRVFQALFTFGNTAFIGIPLILSLYPKDGGLYIAWLSIVDNLFLWTYGVYLVSGEKKPDLKNMMNPATFAVLLGLLVVLCRLSLPDVLLQTFMNLGKSSTPVCFLYLGAMFYFCNPFSVLKNSQLYLGIFIKMLLLPFVFGKCLNLFSLSDDMKQVLVILMSLPTMTLIPMLVPENSREKPFAVGTALLTIAASLFTIPMTLFITF